MKSKVTELTLARLYNLGEYEHIKYEIRVEVGNRKPGALLDKIETVLAGLNPKEPQGAHNYARYLNWLALDQADKEAEVLRFAGAGLCPKEVRKRIAHRNKEARTSIREHEQWLKRRKLAKAALDEMA